MQKIEQFGDIFDMPNYNENRISRFFKNAKLSAKQYLRKSPKSCLNCNCIQFRIDGKCEYCYTQNDFEALK